tara:strand:- start:273 stop:434 length:162 start_codon:yes stop_codon:yes gene_type:complete
MVRLINYICNMNIYEEKLKLGAYYTYDKNNKKVYDIKTMREDFKVLVKKLKKK